MKERKKKKGNFKSIKKKNPRKQSECQKNYPKEKGKIITFPSQERNSFVSLKDPTSLGYI